MRIALVALLAVCLAIPAPRGANAQQEEVIRAEGCGTILAGDIPQAKDEALIAARVKAIEQVSAVLVDSEALLQNTLLFDAVVRTHATGYIKSDRILSEGPKPDGTYCTHIEAWVIPGELRERLQSLVSELAIVVTLPELNMGRPNPSASVEGEIVQRLVDAGYRVFDPQHAETLRTRESAEAARRGDPEEARRIGLRFLANILITGEVTSEFSQNTGGIISAHARGTVRAIETETGRIIATFSQQGVRGFALSDDQAGRKALAEYGKGAAASLLGKLDEHFKRKDRLVEIRVRGLPDEDALARFKNYLQALRWVQDVQQRSFSPGESVVTVIYPEKTVYLASRIGREPGYRLVAFDRSRITIEAGVPR